MATDVRYAGTVANGDSAGGDREWTTPENAQGADAGTGSGTIVLLDPAATFSYPLRCTNFGFALDIASVKGIQIRVMTGFAPPDLDVFPKDLDAYFYLQGSYSDDLGSLTNFPEWPNRLTFGGPTSLWGISAATWKNNINRSDMRFEFIAVNENSDYKDVNAAVYEVEMTVYYTTLWSGSTVLQATSVIAVNAVETYAGKAVIQASAILAALGGLIHSAASVITAAATITAGAVLQGALAASLAGSASMAANATVTHAGAAALTASAQLAAVSSVDRFAAAALNAMATVSPAASASYAGTAALTGAVTVQAGGSLLEADGALLLATGDLVAVPSAIWAGAAQLDAAASLVAAATMDRLAVASLAATSSVVADGTVIAGATSAAVLTCSATLTAAGTVALAPPLAKVCLTVGLGEELVVPFDSPVVVAPLGAAATVGYEPLTRATVAAGCVITVGLEEADCT